MGLPDGGMGLPDGGMGFPGDGMGFPDDMGTSNGTDGELVFDDPDDSMGSSGSMTTEEQIAILDEQLEQGTGDFDDLIVRERGTIRRTTKSVPGRSAGQTANSDIPDTSNSPFNIPATSNGGGGGYGGSPPQQTAAVHAPPADIPSGTDDDVVARQLREAAMREPDPELREKLWDEYRKYKGIER